MYRASERGVICHPDSESLMTYSRVTMRPLAKIFQPIPKAFNNHYRLSFVQVDLEFNLVSLPSWVPSLAGPQNVPLSRSRFGTLLTCPHGISWVSQ